MQIGQFNSIQNLMNFSNSSKSGTLSINQPTNIYKADSIAINTYNTSTEIPKEPYTPPPTEKPKFFDSGTVRLAGMVLGAGVVVGGIGAGIGSALGKSVATSAAIGSGVGMLIPVALVAYGLYRWGKN